MPGLGTIMNTAAIVTGGLIGLLLKKAFSEGIQNAVMKGTGICVFIIGIAGTLEKMLQITDAGLTASGSMLLIVSVALGGAVGGWIDFEGLTERFGIYLRKKSGSEGDSGFLDAFLSSSLTVCIGAMAVVGSLQDGISGDHATLFAKSLLDFIIIMIMASSMGRGCIFSAIPVAVFQGTITLLARFIEPLLTEYAAENLSMVGSALILGVGINLIWGKKIPVANLLPAVVFAVALSYIM